jgi:hypothetical protein
MRFQFSRSTPTCNKHRPPQNKSPGGVRRLSRDQREADKIGFFCQNHTLCSFIAQSSLPPTTVRPSARTLKEPLPGKAVPQGGLTGVTVPINGPENRAFELEFRRRVNQSYPPGCNGPLLCHEQVRDYAWVARGAVDVTGVVGAAVRVG